MVGKIHKLGLHSWWQQFVAQLVISQRIRNPSLRCRAGHGCSHPRPITSDLPLLFSAHIFVSTTPWILSLTSIQLLAFIPAGDISDSNHEEGELILKVLLMRLQPWLAAHVSLVPSLFQMNLIPQIPWPSVFLCGPLSCFPPNWDVFLLIPNPSSFLPNLSFLRSPVPAPQVSQAWHLTLNSSKHLDAHLWDDFQLLGGRHNEAWAYIKTVYWG